MALIVDEIQVESGFTGTTIYSTGILVTGTIEATTYQGNGSGLTGIIASNPASNLGNYYNFI